MAFIGNEIYVKLKSPDIIFFPIFDTIDLPTLLIAFTMLLFLRALPPSLWALSGLSSPFSFRYENCSTYYYISSLDGS